VQQTRPLYPSGNCLSQTSGKHHSPVTAYLGLYYQWCDRFRHCCRYCC